MANGLYMDESSADGAMLSPETLLPTLNNLSDQVNFNVSAVYIRHETSRTWYIWQPGQTGLTFMGSEGDMDINLFIKSNSNAAFITYNGVNHYNRLLPKSRPTT